MNKWQPIETAPKSGEVRIIVDLYTVEDGRVPDCILEDGVWKYWSEYGDYEYSPHFEPLSATPTHWMYIPEAPQ